MKGMRTLWVITVEIEKKKDVLWVSNLLKEVAKEKGIRVEISCKDVRKVKKGAV